MQEDRNPAVELQAAREELAELVVRGRRERALRAMTGVELPPELAQAISEWMRGTTRPIPAEAAQLPVTLPDGSEKAFSALTAEEAALVYRTFLDAAP